MKKKYSKTTEEFKKDILKLENKNYELLSEYKNCHTKVLMKHNECGNTYEVCPTDFLSGYRCPKCKHSLGEKIIREWLIKNNFSFEEQFSFSDCIYKRPLKFDFKVNIDKNDFVLIEFDGIQHFQKMWYDKNFENQKIRDKIKDDYCEKNNITLFRINYTQFDNLENILTETFNDYRNHI